VIDSTIDRVAIVGLEFFGLAVEFYRASVGEKERTFGSRSNGGPRHDCEKTVAAIVIERLHVRPIGNLRSVGDAPESGAIAGEPDVPI